MYERANDKEGMGAIVWTGVCVIALVVAIAMTCCGCEDDGDTTIIYEGDDITAGSNTQVVIVDNTGTVSVDQTISEDGEDPSIYIGGNTGKVYVTTRPEPPPAPEPEL